MKIYIISTLFFLATVSCNSQVKTERTGEPAIYISDDEDLEMNKAIQTANQSIDAFQKALKSGNTGFDGFSIKVRFDTGDGGGEHIWVSYIESLDNELYGIVDNLPETVKKVLTGTRIKVDKNRISDWMYLDKNELRGGYTIRVIRDRMTEREKKAFDKECGFVIEY